jgi:hypothetical protein
MTADDCIHAMKILSSLQNLCYVMSAIEAYDTDVCVQDFDDACNELADRVSEFITSCDKRLDTATQPGG